jgi:hypothetical protein
MPQHLWLESQGEWKQDLGMALLATPSLDLGHPSVSCHCPASLSMGLLGEGTRMGTGESALEGKSRNHERH